MNRKEINIMILRNTKELALFETAVDRCSRSLLFLSPNGKQYDLKNPFERYFGITEMLKSYDGEEPELFTCCREDEEKIIEFFSWKKALA